MPKNVQTVVMWLSHKSTLERGFFIRTLDIWYASQAFPSLVLGTTVSAESVSIGRQDNDGWLVKPLKAP